MEMTGRTTDPKRLRITIRITESDRESLEEEARTRGISVSKLVRLKIRGALPPSAEGQA